MYKTDHNQQALVKNLRQIGFTVANTAMVKNGFVDIVVGIFGLNFLCEIKNPELPASARKLTFMEEKFHSEWRGSVHILQTLEDCIKLKEYALKLSKIIQASLVFS